MVTDLNQVKDSYKTIHSKNSFELKIQKSHFIAQVFPFTNPEDLPKIISEVKKKYFDSAHNPFAYRLGLEKVQFRFNDDGEPSGSAGKPILDCIDKYGLTDIIIIVSRYFGGIKLGVGGLKRAFFDAAEGVLQNTKIIEKYVFKKILLGFDYKHIGSVMNYIEKNSIHILENNSGEKVNLVCEIRLSKIEEFKNFIINLTSGNYRIEEK
jgi:uncharacterized YigZ family protein